MPEEINRKIVDHVSDINMPYSEHARRYLLAEGLPADRVIKTGSPMKEVLGHYRSGIDASNMLNKLELHPNGYFLVSAHREENVDEPSSLTAFLDCLNAIWKKYGLPIIVSTHPRTRKHLDARAGGVVSGDIRFLKPLGFLDYVKLQLGARCVISDSGTITEEASILGVPAITIRNVHERPEGMDEGVLIMSGLDPSRTLQAIEVVIGQHNQDGQPSRLVDDYDVDCVSQKVVRIILSYTDYVNRVVWRKSL